MQDTIRPLQAHDAYIFDWDGTLCATLAVWMDIFHTVLAPYNNTWSDEEIVRRIFGRVAIGLREGGVPADKLDETFAWVQQTAHDRMPHASLYPGARELLQTLKARGKKLAIATGTPRKVMDRQLAEHGLAEVFDCVVTFDDIKEDKPHPETLELACKRLGVSLDQAVMIGDSDKDMGAARNAGMASALFYPKENEPFHSLAELQEFGPTCVIRSWRECVAQLDS